MTRRKNAGEGYGYMFHGAFKEKADAVAKERKTPGAWVKGVYTKQGHRYVVMSPRTNPIKRKAKREIRVGEKRFRTWGAAFKFAKKEAKKIFDRIPIHVTEADGTTLTHYADPPARKNSPGGLAPVSSHRMRVFFDKGIQKFTATKYHPKHGNLFATGFTKKEAANNLKERVREARRTGRANPHELLIMGANPTGAAEVEIPNATPNEFTLPPGSTITIRANPEPRPNWMGYAKHQIDQGLRQDIDRGARAAARSRRRLTRASEAESESYFQGLRRSARAAEPKRAGRVGGKGKLNQLFHELYGRNNPICGHMIGGEPCTRKPGHKGPHLPQGATMRTRARLPRHWQPNPGDDRWMIQAAAQLYGKSLAQLTTGELSRVAQRAAELKLAAQRENPSAAVIREEFTGTPAEYSTVEDEPHMPAGDYAQLGELLALYVKPARGSQVQQINFKHDRPILVSDESARQLAFVGGDQDVTASLHAFGARQRSAGIYELGEARRIDYKQRKEHVPHPEVDEWRHEFGEESGVRPTLLFDQNARRLLLEGGEYEIRREGIIN